MYHRQIGLVPFLFFCIGIFFSIYDLAIVFYVFDHLLTETFVEISWVVPDWSVLWALLNLEAMYRISMSALFSYYIFMFGVMFMDLFPAIKVDETGIFVKNLLGVDHFTWEEVRYITSAQRFKNTKVVVLAPNGNPILNFIRYYPYFMHALIAGGVYSPVVLLSGGLSQREEIQKEIGRQILNKIKSQTSLPIKV